MRKYYTRPCNFYYGNYARKLVKNNKALTLAGNTNISFDKLEIIQRKKDKTVDSNIYTIKEISSLKGEIKKIINSDLKKITSKRKNICGLKFNNSKIMGVLNVTPDSFSDGGLFFNQIKAYDQAVHMTNNGAAIIDVGGESTRPGSKIVNEENEWKRIKNVIIKLKKNFQKYLYL